MTRFLQTDRSWILLLQRIALGGVVLGHGLQKAFGWWGGGGIDGTLAFFDSIGVPGPLGALVILTESVGALALIAGLLTRLTAVGTLATMLGAILLVHLPNGFFMNWSGAKPGEGYELHLLAIALAIPLVIRGGGLASVDGWLADRRPTPV
jgi:putative oxidoreductase